MGIYYRNIETEVFRISKIKGRAEICRIIISMEYSQVKSSRKLARIR